MQPKSILTKLTRWIDDEDISLELRIKRVAFSITMLIVVILGGAMLTLALIDIPTNQKKSHQGNVNLIGEVLSTDIQDQLNITKQLSNSSLVWTALTDSSGREAYLRPYLLEQSKNSNIEMALLDYRGRQILGMATESIKPNLREEVISEVIGKNKSEYLIIANNENPYLLAFFPVIFPNTKEPIGVLLGKINLSKIFQQRSAGLAPDLGLDITYQKAIIGGYNNNAATKYFPAQFDLSIGEPSEADSIKLRIYATQNPWLLPLAERILLSFILAGLLGALVWRISGAIAFRLSRRLTSLADSCLHKSDGRRIDFPIDSAKDEIGILSRTLRQTINAYDQMNAHLEELVNEKTKELHESESRLRTIIEHEPECINIIDVRGHLTQMNPAGLAMIEADSLEQVVNNPILNVIAPEYSDDFDKMHQRVIAGETMQMEFEVIGLKGRRRWLETHATPMQDHGETVHLAVTRDITERKHAESELLRSNTELEQFGYSISHDMRQPLRMISSYLQLLESGLSDQLDASQREYLNFAIDGAKRMDEMMLGLLEYSRIGRKGEPSIVVDSRAVLDEALLFLRPAISEAHAVTFIEGDWPHVFASRDELVRLLQNLISNALKFRVEGRTPEVTITSKTEGTEWRVSVSDNGIGINPDQIERLFKVFQRLQSRSAYEGTGIGLALCRKIVEHHGGRIRAESLGENQGCSFSFSLPITSLGNS